MTIKQKIEMELKTLRDTDDSLYDICYCLNRDINTIIREASDHLSKIQAQMPDYDRHSKEHSEKVLENIELLLQDKGIRELTLLEAMLIELCCYFHDTGMALPDWGFKLLEEVEEPEYVFHHNGKPVRTIIEELSPRTCNLYGSFKTIQDLFFCPTSERELHSLLAQEIWDYECYRMGLSTPSAELDSQTYRRLTRQEYLRSTHAHRTETYAKNISKNFTSLGEYDAAVLAISIGKICYGHCVDIKEIQNLKANSRICGSKTNENFLAYNERYIAMLLRLGDVIHFSSDRASRTLYAEHTPMNPVSDSHWQVKLDNLEYRIEQKENKTTISYFSGFKKPQLFYFLQDYLNWVDDELKYYAAFVQDMEQLQQSAAARYRIGLPTSVDRSGVKSLGFTPDDKLKFRLEQKKVIQLLMGLRLYSDEFMCLRELYQNALDSCRCMQAKKMKDGLSGEFPIEFGIALDDGGKYLYCRDSGTGMTKEIILNFLLQVGNSYYNSSDFRRQNAIWGNSVAPVSEFGIGLLSCYMIGTRIEVITRHYSANSKVYWICMEGTEDYGYFRDATPEVAEEIGDHGTIIKVYIKEKFKDTIKTAIPSDIKSAVYLYNIYSEEVIDETPELPTISNRVKLSNKGKDVLLGFHKSLYQILQSYIHIPEPGIPVYIVDNQNTKHKIIASNSSIELAEEIETLLSYGLSLEEIQYGQYAHYETLPIDRTKVDEYKSWLNNFAHYSCNVIDEEHKIEAYSILHLPIAPYDIAPFYFASKLDQYVGSKNNQSVIYIDGIPIYNGYGYGYEDDLVDDVYESGILFNFKGTIRPTLTVNREQIREIPKNVKPLVESIGNSLIIEITKVIVDHYKRYPDAKAAGSLKYLDRYLSQKYPASIYYKIMQELSCEFLADYSICENKLRDLLSQKIFTIPTTKSVQSWNRSSKIFSILLSQANRVVVNDENIHVEQQNNSNGATHFSYRDSDSIIICADEWSTKFQQYDVVTNYWPFIPKKTFSLCKNINHSLPSNPIIKRMSSGSILGMNIHDLGTLNWDTQYGYSHHIKVKRSDILLLLNSKPSDGITCSCSFQGLLGEKDKKYVIYGFINPQDLSEKEEQELSYFSNIPDYIRGVREGWSILFYRYQDGYTIAPGIVSREEMIKRIPDVARNHDDGITYCFTDETVAF